MRWKRMVLASESAFPVGLLLRVFGRPAREVDLVSPYFVPGESGVEMFSSLTRRGVRMRVLTNALERPTSPSSMPATRNAVARFCEVCLTSDGMQWVERRGGTTVVHRSEPRTGRWKRMAVVLLSALPIEPLL